MVIMAGGMGTRLRPLTENCPKPMLEVRGKPMLEHIVERAKADGFRRFVIAIHYLGSVIEEYFERGTKWGVEIDYLHGQDPLGTAGALSLISERPTLPIVVTNGDVMTDLHYSEMLEFHLRHQAVATMAVRQHELQNPFGVVKTQGVDIVGFEEKPLYRCHVQRSHSYSSNRAIEETNRNIKFLNEQIEKTRIVEVQRKRPVITRVLESSIGPGPSRSAAAMRWCFP
jgi:NDP-sugar pyrophosphorylase family protein